MRATRPLQTLETSHGKLRPRRPRNDRTSGPKTPSAAAAAPYQDPATGRFTAGNPGGRLRQLAKVGRMEAESLLRLPVMSVAPWLRPHLHAAQHHAQALVDSLPSLSAELVELAGDEAKARLMASAALTEGAREDCPPDVAKEWRAEARAWFREVRQTVLTRRGVARDVPFRAVSSSITAAIEASADRAALQADDDDLIDPPRSDIAEPPPSDRPGPPSREISHPPEANK